MGAWSASIAGNDTAMDLRSEYQAAFSYCDADTALQKLDAYVCKEFGGEENPEEWCDYVYSLADFMWKKGILTDGVRDEAIRMIDSGFGLDVWAESGEKMLAKRKKVLAAFREQLLLPQCPPKKMKVDLNLHAIFGPGQLVALQLKTAQKTYLSEESAFTEKTFREADGKWVVFRYVRDYISYRSACVPEVADHWAMCQVYARLFDHCPVAEELAGIPFALFDQRKRPASGSQFICESSMFHFKRRNAQVIGVDMRGLESLPTSSNMQVFLSVNRSGYNPDTALLNAVFRRRR